MISAERTIDSEIILDALDDTPRWVKWNLISVCLELVLILMQDRCTVFIECTTGMEIILGTPDGTPR
jgi:hypothetical protein